MTTKGWCIAQALSVSGLFFLHVLILFIFCWFIYFCLFLGTTIFTWLTTLLLFKPTLQHAITLRNKDRTGTRLKRQLKSREHLWKLFIDTLKRKLGSLKVKHIRIALFINCESCLLFLPNKLTSPWSKRCQGRSICFLIPCVWAECSHSGRCRTCGPEEFKKCEKRIKT